MNLTEVFSVSILIPAIIGMIRFKKIDSAYTPFLYLLWIGLINESVGFFTARTMGSNALNGNIYLLLEGLLILYQFRRWGLFSKSKTLYHLTFYALIFFWTVEALMVRDAKKEYVSYYLIFYSFAVALFSINQLNRLIASEARDFLKHPVFIISVGFIVFFSYAAFVELVYLFGQNLSIAFQTNVQNIVSFINLFVNLLYAVAVLWIPRRYGFSL